jgi:hypothetical protein
MFGSAVLDVAVGLVFAFLLVSILCTAIREGIEAWLKTRAAYLEYGIRELLQDKNGTGLAAALYQHPLIYGLFSGEYHEPSKEGKPGLLARGENFPSYIPAGNFALALMDLAARGPDPARSKGAGAPIVDLEQVRAGVAQALDGPIERALLAAIDSAQGDLTRAQKNIEAWYDSAMDRVSGWYKRSTQKVILGVALFTAIALNVNAVALADFLYRDGTVRNALVAQAGAAVENKEYLAKGYQQVRDDLQSMALPIGWGEPLRLAHQSAQKNGGDWRWWFVLEFLKGLPGCLVTALAAMLGAPFWFDVLNKVMVIRSTVKPREKSGEEGSEDRQAPAAPVHLHAGGAAPTARLAAATDTCDVDMTVNPTTDEELPRARGGVA